MPARPQRLAALLLVMAGCKEVAAPLRDTLILGTIADPSSFDPAFVGRSGDREVLSLAFRELTVLDDAWRLRPDLAAELPLARTSSSGFSVTWRLRDGLRWSDGAPLLANDVRFGWQIEKNPALEAISHETARKVASMRVLDPQRVEVRWAAPFADYAAPRVHAVLPAHAYPAPRPGQPFAGMQVDPVSNGPFRLMERAPAEHLVFERNPYWSGPAPALSRVIFRIFPSEDGFEAALATGAVHALGEASGLTPDRVAALRARLEGTHEVVSRDGGVLLHLDVRHDHPALGRADVRRAVSAAIDRAALADVTYDGLARPAFGLFPPKHPGHDAAPAKGAGDPRVLERLPEAQRKLTLGIGAGSGAAARAGAFVQAALESAGLDVGLEVQPMGTLFSRMREGTQPELVLYAWRVRPDWDGASVLRTGARQNYGRFSDPALDRVLDGLSTTLEPGPRQRTLRAVDRAVRAKLPIIPLLFRQTVSVRPKTLDGWRPTGTVTPVTWNAEHWRWRR